MTTKHPDTLAWEKLPFFHELPDEQIKELLESGMTWGQLMEKYNQPSWCGYPNALNGQMGCWSLVDMYGERKNISPEYCKNCDCFQARVKAGREGK
jgi:hypothetical protein